MIRQHGEIDRYNHNIIGHNYRMSAIQGGVLSVKIKFIKEWTELRRKNAKIYNKLLADEPCVITPKEIENSYCVYHLYIILAKKFL